MRRTPRQVAKGFAGLVGRGNCYTALQDSLQGVTVAVLAVGLMVVGLLAVRIPLSPALEGT